MKKYECLFIINPDLEGDRIHQVVEKVKRYLEEAKGEVRFLQHWGKRRLAYPIEKHRLGHYVLIYFEGESPDIAFFQRELEIDEAILAYITVRLKDFPAFEQTGAPPEIKDSLGLPRTGAPTKEEGDTEETIEEELEAGEPEGEAVEESGAASEEETTADTAEVAVESETVTEPAKAEKEAEGDTPQEAESQEGQSTPAPEADEAKEGAES